MFRWLGSVGWLEEEERDHRDPERGHVAAPGVHEGVPVRGEAAPDRRGILGLGRRDQGVPRPGFSSRMNIWQHESSKETVLRASRPSASARKLSSVRRKSDQSSQYSM